MRNLRVPAIRINQIDPDNNEQKNKKEIFLASIKVKDLINESQFQIDYWSASKRGSDDQGYQRYPNPAHYRKIGKYATEKDAIFPGIILVSCRDKNSKVQFNSKGGEIGELDLERPPFWIIDGQHRVKGLQYVIEEEKDDRWSEKELPVVILAGFTKIEEVSQFHTLNSKSKKVSTDLAQQLMFLRSKSDNEYFNSLKERGEDWKIRCLRLIDKLNETNESPWSGRIKLPNSKNTARQIVGQNSFLVSLKPMYSGGYFESTRNIDLEYEILKNYWGALMEVFPFSFQTPSESVIIKTPGIFSLHYLLRAILQRRGASKELISQKSFVLLLKKIFKDESRYGDYFWSSDNTTGASLYGSMKGFRILSDEFISNLEDALSEDD